MDVLAGKPVLRLFLPQRTPTRSHHIPVLAQLDLVRVEPRRIEPDILQRKRHGVNREEMARSCEPQLCRIAGLQLGTPGLRIADIDPRKAATGIRQRPVKVGRKPWRAHMRAQRTLQMLLIFALGLLPALDHGLGHGRSPQ